MYESRVNYDMINPYLAFFSVLILLFGLCIFLNSDEEGFFDYVFVPAWRRRWGGGPPPWAGGWRWRPWGWGRYGWGPRWGYDPRVKYVTYVEPFGNENENPEELIKDKESENPIFMHKPNGPSPIDFSGREPYHLLRDVFPPAGSKDDEEKISKVNSRSCYATDFKRLLESSSYRQMTNNFKHGYPDSCSAPYQELVLNFYKGDGMKIDVPANCM